MLLQPVLSNPWVRAVGVLLLLVLLAFSVYALSSVLVPLFLAFLVAYVFDPLVDFFEARRIPRFATIAVLALAAVAILVSVPLIVVPGMVRQADAIIHLADHKTEEAKAKAAGLNKWLEKTLESDQMIDAMRLMGWVDKDAQDVDPLDVIRKQVGLFVRTQSVDLLQQNASAIASTGRTAGATLFDLVSSLSNRVVKFILLFGNFVLFAVVAGYMLKDFDGIVAGARLLLPPRYEPKTVEVVSKIDLQLRGFLRGQLTVCLCLGALYTIGFLVSGLQALAVAIGAFTVVAAFVPIIGVTCVGITAITLTILQYGIDWHILGVLITIAIVQTLEANVLTPMIVGDRVGLSPVWVILAIMVFGNVFGFFGVLIAVPLAAALKVLVVEAVTYYKKSPVFEGDEPVEIASLPLSTEVDFRPKRARQRRR